MPAGPALVWKGFHDRPFVRIHHRSNMRPWLIGFQQCRWLPYSKRPTTQG
jgi:hypothetical protein